MPEYGTSEGIASKIVPGKILYLSVFFPHETIPHNKYMVVAGFEKRPLLLKINSDNTFTKTNKRLREFQFRLKSSVYTFLIQDSYLDCGTVWNNLLDHDNITDQLTADPSRIKGDLLKDHCNEVVNLTSKSKSIINLHKRIIAESFRG